jgi:energy-coupling factor transporter ATP-binding protein EcfA2
MQLKTFSYCELEQTPQEWVLEELRLGQRTLLVGKNASGKSRALMVMYGLAKNLASLQPIATSGTFSCTLEGQGKVYVYRVSTEKGHVLSEILQVNGTIVLERGAGGIGKIWAEKVDKGQFIEFQTPTTEFAAVARRDSIQHSYFELLYEWAANVRHFQFGTNLGKDRFAVFGPGGLKPDERDQSIIVAIFKEAKQAYEDKFLDAVKRDMSAIGYQIEKVDIGPPVSIQIAAMGGGAIPEVMCLFVKEADLPGITDQLGMSQGMFRVLTLLIYVNYLELKQSPTLMLVDDIGEGLDYDRSCRLIKLLRHKADDSNLQIVLSTNDRFVMNEVPLEEWSILQRHGNRVSIKNIENSREIFEGFKFSGLSNFSFFELDVVNEAIGEASASRA